MWLCSSGASPGDLDPDNELLHSFLVKPLKFPVPQGMGITSLVPRTVFKRYFCILQFPS